MDATTSARYTCVAYSLRDGGGYTTELHLISPDTIVVVRSRHHDLVGAAQEALHTFALTPEELELVRNDIVES